MKRLTVFLGLLIISQSCNNICSNPPDPKLTQEAKQWIEPYRTKPLFIYQTQQSNRDTLLVRYTAETEFCGGDECGSACEVQRATLTSKTDSTLRITIQAEFPNVVAINNYSLTGLPDSTLLSAGVYTSNKRVFRSTSVAQVSYLTSYMFGNEPLTVIQASCEKADACKQLKMSFVLVSKEKGLLGYTDQHNQRWTLIN